MAESAMEDLLKTIAGDEVLDVVPVRPAGEGARANRETKAPISAPLVEHCLEAVDQEAALEGRAHILVLKQDARLIYSHGGHAATTS